MRDSNSCWVASFGAEIDAAHHGVARTPTEMAGTIKNVRDAFSKPFSTTARSISSGGIVRHLLTYTTVARKSEADGNL